MSFQIDWQKDAILAPDSQRIKKSRINSLTKLQVTRNVSIHETFLLYVLNFQRVKIGPGCLDPVEIRRKGEEF